MEVFIKENPKPLIILGLILIVAIEVYTFSYTTNNKYILYGQYIKTSKQYRTDHVGIDSKVITPISFTLPDMGPGKHIASLDDIKIKLDKLKENPQLDYYYYDRTKSKTESTDLEDQNVMKTSPARATMDKETIKELGLMEDFLKAHGEYEKAFKKIYGEGND